MSFVVPKWMKAIAGALLILLLVVVVNRWYGDYKAQSSPKEPTGSTQTKPEQGQGNEAEAAKSDAKGEDKPADKSDAEAESKTVVVLTDGLNFREEKSQSSNVIRGLDKGEKLVLIKKDSGWYQVKDDKDTVGWISANPDYSKVQ